MAPMSMVGRRAAGEPLQYILGTWSFRQLEVAVDARALIPRPETKRWSRWHWRNCGAADAGPAGDATDLLWPLI